jgi:succinyl-CoA synthetase beta subunit
VIEPGFGLQGFQARKLAFGHGMPAATHRRGGEGDDGAGQGLRRPMPPSPRSTPSSSPKTASRRARRQDGFDDNALFRHKELVELRDLNEEDPLEPTRRTA